MFILENIKKHFIKVYSIHVESVNIMVKHNVILEHTMTHNTKNTINVSATQQNYNKKTYSVKT